MTKKERTTDRWHYHEEEQKKRERCTEKPREDLRPETERLRARVASLVTIGLRQGVLVWIVRILTLVALLSAARSVVAGARGMLTARSAARTSARSAARTSARSAARTSTRRTGARAVLPARSAARTSARSAGTSARSA